MKAFLKIILSFVPVLISASESIVQGSATLWGKSSNNFNGLDLNGDWQFVPTLLDPGSCGTLTYTDKNFPNIKL